MDYEQQAYKDTLEWRKKMRKKASFFERVSKSTQKKLNSYIPEKVHKIMTDAIKTTIKTILTGSNLAFQNALPQCETLEEKEFHIKEQLNKYRKAATVEGAGTGAGGIFLGLADFPLLLSIKIKFLFDVARLHECNLKKYEERIFLLLVFQLAFSSSEKRNETLEIIENWNVKRKELTDLDWQTFQQEYRDYIDLAKMLQLFPGIGAAVGAYANYKLLDQLGDTALYAYRIRYFNEK